MPKTLEELEAELNNEKKARSEAEADARETKKQLAVARRATTAAEKKVKELEEVAASKAKAREKVEEADEDLDDEPEPEKQVSVKMVERSPLYGHFRSAHSAVFGGRIWRFEAGKTYTVPEGLARSLLEVRDKREKGGAEGPRVFALT